MRGLDGRSLILRCELTRRPCEAERKDAIRTCGCTPCRAYSLLRTLFIAHKKTSDKLIEIAGLGLSDKK